MRHPSPLHRVNPRRSSTTAAALSVAALIAIAGSPTGTARAAVAGTVTDRVSVSSDGAPGTGDSVGWSMSGNGRYVAFDSSASNLVSGDSNRGGDVFVRDRRTATTSRVSVARDGTQANGESWHPSISADGRYVAFTSAASNLVPGDTNDVNDVIVKDRRTGITTRASVSHTGAEGNDISWQASISADGRFVAFLSRASNLTAGDTNDAEDVFVRDSRRATTTRVSVSSAGAEANSYSIGPASISANGRYVAFESSASNLVAQDTNEVNDVFVRDLHLGATSRVGVFGQGDEGNGSYRPSISADGRYVAYYSASSNLVPADTNNGMDVFVYDGRTGAISRASVSSTGLQTDGGNFHPAISGNGRYVTFVSLAPNLVAGDTNLAEDVFTRDMVTGTTTRTSVSSAGTQANGRSMVGFISADGRTVGFTSYASNLIPGDTNEMLDVFIRSTASVPPPRM
jgi:Tol biopolymer transport system component